MAAKDANDTRRGNQKVTDLQSKRLAVRAEGGKPLCGSPLKHARIVGHEDYGKTCTHPAGWGTDHPGYGNCKIHAGSMNPSKVSAARERIADEVQQFKRFYGERAEIGFEEAFLEEMQRSVGVVRWLEERISQWTVDTLPSEGLWKPGETGLPDLMTEHMGYRAITVSDSEHQAVLRHYLLERRHLAEVCKAGIQAGIAKQIVELHSRQAELMYAILQRALQVLAPDKMEQVPLILPAIIREVTGRAS